MRENPLKKNSRFYLGMVLNVAEGMLSGFNFLLLYEAMKMLWNGTINSPSLLRLSLFLGGVFILRISKVLRPQRDTLLAALWS